MKLNKIEKALMNNPLRAFSQRHHEARIFEKFGGKTSGQKVLEIGCGQGVGTEIILDRFGAREVDAFDLDPDMVERARERLARFPQGTLNLCTGDASKIAAPDNNYDAVFDFGIIHHVPVWQDAVKEVARVLKPGGKFYFEEVTKAALDSRLYRTLFVHPSENRFSAAQFIDELDKSGIQVGSNFRHWLFGDLFMGVGIKNTKENR